MIQCQNCGLQNAPESNFCRSCGTRFIAPQVAQNDNNYGYSQPRPYAWKTDEYQTQNEARKTQNINRVQPLMGQYPNNAPQSLAHQQPNQMAQGYHCPRCGTNYLPRIERRISTAGWIVFALLLIFSMGLFCWIGLLIKEEYRVCPICKLQIG
ncbi:MAG TPA: LITAF-like zinc ribbon domain-containing protein [Pyrinomonadaceae bacterium]|nr:LITAF-like zinc ribbon domain-containing protein [Pyrinomonadaceae bacterium]